MEASQAAAQTVQTQSPSLQLRVEQALERWFAACAVGARCPPRLADAQRYALFPGGGRLRPQLCLVTAMACGDARPTAADAAAASVELLHGASLIQDDLPCFDDADVRRGRLALHRVVGEPLAILVADAFIVHAFDVLARVVALAPKELEGLLPELAAAAGTRKGLLAGQAWESEPAAPLEEYHSAKTASLFEAAAAMGAIASGGRVHRWREVGHAIGRAYQAADDLLDATQAKHEGMKPVGRDAALGRPSIVHSVGVDAARARVELWLDRAFRSVPDCANKPLAMAWLDEFARKLETSGVP